MVLVHEHQVFLGCRRGDKMAGKEGFKVRVRSTHSNHATMGAWQGLGLGHETSYQLLFRGTRGLIPYKIRYHDTVPLFNDQKCPRNQAILYVLPANRPSNAPLHHSINKVVTIH